MIEGIDYSRGGFPGGAILNAAGKRFAGRYATSDLSPSGRGITAAEYADLRAAGVDVYLYWEAEQSWMLGGYARGVAAARDAERNRNAAGMPDGMPVYFACDFDAAPRHQPAINACLAGAAEVIGKARVGLYAGYFPLARARDAGVARWYCQTSAWSGGLVMPGAHLYQYGYNAYFGGVNCDLVRALQPRYGGAADFGADPVPETDGAPTYPAAELPEWYERADGRDNPSAARWDENTWYPMRANVVALKTTYLYTRPDTKSEHAAPPIPAGTKLPVRWAFVDGDDRKWYVNATGYCRASGFTPDLPLPEARS